MTRRELDIYLKQYLDCDNFVDYCVNGLQVEGADEIKNIVTGVSASEKLFQAAVDLQADTIIVHHGLFWKNTQHPLAIRGILKKRLKLLFLNDINLFGFHLPLDSHAEIGNNVLIANKLMLSSINQEFISGMNNPIAVSGDLKEKMSISSFGKYVDQALDSEGLLLPFEKREIERVFVLSGGGGSHYNDAVLQGADIFITGEITESTVRASEENDLALYAAGHYNSEKPGIKALGEHLENEFNLNVTFVDIPNPV